MIKYLKSLYLPAMLGAAIEYYDIALYGFLAPVLVPVFLPHLQKTTAYFVYFAFEFFAALCQLLGARYYGKMGDRHGRKQAMYRAMLGTSCATCAIAILPTYQMAGSLAVILFACARAAQSFFLGGEYNGGAIYCLEHEQDRRTHSLISGLYCALTVVGIITASIVATAVHALGASYFRLAYAISFLLALGTYRIRCHIRETPEYCGINSNPSPASFTTPSVHYGFFSIAIGSLFFGMIYGIPTRLFNVLLPLAIGIDSHQIMILNSVFLVVYMLLLVAFGVIACHCGAVRVMAIATVGTIILTYPLMLLIETNSFLALIIAKTLFAALTAGFIAPFHTWAQSFFQANVRYQHISTAYSGGKCCSTLLLAASILLYERTQSIASIGAILIITALFITRRLFHAKSITNHEYAAPLSSYK